MSKPTPKSVSHPQYLIKMYLVLVCHKPLRYLGSRPIDVMTIDTEGSELAIILSFPWHKHNVKIVMIETLDEVKYPSNRNKQRRITKHMQIQGYTLFLKYVVAADDTYDLIL